MKQRPRIYYTESQKALMWERWRAGDNLHQIANLFDRHHTSVQGNSGANGRHTTRAATSLELGADVG